MSLEDPSVARPLCAHGCYWPCEHRAPAEVTRPETPSKAFRQAMPVHDEHGRPLQRCRICGGGFYAAADHEREHERMRVLGQLPERYPRNWPAVLPKD